MKEYYDQPITASTDWGGDASTNNKPVTGRRVQEFIKSELATKATKDLATTENDGLMSKEDKECLSIAEYKSNGVFSYLAKKDLKLVKFIKSFHYEGSPSNVRVCFWNATRNVNGQWVIRFAFINSEEYSGYIINQTFNSEISVVDIEENKYFNGQLLKVKYKIELDWTALPDGESYYSDRESNEINSNNFKFATLIENKNFDIQQYYNNDNRNARIINFFKSIKIYGDFNTRISPFLIERGGSKGWLIYFVEYNTLNYIIPITLNEEQSHIYYKINDNSAIELLVDWSVLDAGELANVQDSTLVRVSDIAYGTFPYNELTGKKILLFGDSISALVRYGKSYASILEDITGCKITNVAIGGTKITQRGDLYLTPSSSNEAYSSLDVVALVKAFIAKDFTYQDNANEWIIANRGSGVTEQLNILKSTNIADYDYIFISAGHNDLNYATIGDIDSGEIRTINGAINNIVTNITNANKSIKLFAFTPIVCYASNERTPTDWCDRHNGENGYKWGETVSFIAQAWQRNHIPVADMYYSLGITEGNFSNFFPTNDPVHPNVLTLEKMAYAINKFVNSYYAYHFIRFDNKPLNPYFDKLNFAYQKFNLRCAKFFKKVRIIGASPNLKLSIWNIDNKEGSYNIYLLAYNEDPNTSGGYECVIRKDEPTAFLKGNLSSGGSIELIVDWDELKGEGLSASNRSASRFSPICYENWE